jgi:hypothetical protein
MAEVAARDDIDHDYTQEIVCPHCGEEHGDSWEYNLGDSDTIEVECEECSEPFYATCCIEVTYSTSVITAEDRERERKQKEREERQRLETVAWLQARKFRRFAWFQLRGAAR